MAIAQPPSTLLNEILDFLASAPSPEEIVAFNASEPLNERLHYLLDQNRENLITADERSELDEFLRMGHFMTLLKIRARQKLKSS
jgi:hypothetical protein